MKKVLYCTAVVALSALMVGCKSSKEVTSPNKINGDQVKVEVPCSKYSDDDAKYIRANASGEDSNPTIAQKKATSNLSSALANKVEVKVSEVTENYFKSLDVNATIDSRDRFEGLTKTAIKQSLKLMKNPCQETYKSKETGYYTYYVSGEISADQICEEIKKIAKEDQIYTDFQYEKFKQEFDKVMSENE